MVDQDSESESKILNLELNKKKNKKESKSTGKEGGNVSEPIASTKTRKINDELKIDRSKKSKVLI
jgi:hypothetical protein